MLYKHPEGSSDVSVPCLRVRNCDEIVAVTQEQVDEMNKIVESDEYKQNIYSNYNDGDSNTNSTDVDNKNNGDNKGSSLAQKINSMIKTGDNSNVPLYVGIAVSALAIMIIVYVLYKKKYNR